MNTRAIPEMLITILVTLALAACSAELEPPATAGADDRVSAAAPTADAGDEAAAEVGEVQFETTCADEVKANFNDAVAMLHSFEFADARSLFSAIGEADPDCAIAHWGVAMTHYHPLWAPPNQTELEEGSAAVTKAQNLNASPRERAWIEAIGAFYDGADRVPHRQRARRYEQAMADLHRAYPGDEDAAIFYGVAQLANADPTDKNYAVQKRVGTQLEPMFEAMPNHPGIAHYIIHAYDYPALAERAVDAAHRYLDIATSMPHALHMSGHIFAQLGMWQDSIEANIRSAEAARERAGSPQAQMNEVHALDYLVYAYLQTGEDDKAKVIVDDVASRNDLDWQHGVIAFNAGAIPVRYAMERRDWPAAAALGTLEKAEAGGGNYEVRNSIVLRYWARAIGAAQQGDIEQAKSELAELEQHAGALAESDNVWARNTAEVARLQAAGWIAYARGDEGHAESVLRKAAELEGETDKSSLSPGRVLPAHEQLGDLLMNLDRPAKALAAYEQSMKAAPRRYNTYLGAARAAQAAGQPDVAERYYASLVELASEQSGRETLAEARDSL